MKLTKSNEREMTFIRALLHGDSGIGKTTSLRTLPVEHTLVASSERSLLPLRNLSYAVAKIEDWGDLRELLQCFQSGDGPVNGQKFKVLALDSLTDFGEICCKRIVTVDRGMMLSARKGGDDKPRGIYEEQMTMEDWGLYRTRMSSMLAAFNHLPLHIIFTAITSWTEDKVTGAQYRTPALSGKLAYECPKYFDLVLHMESVEVDGENSRVWRTFNDGRVIAKDSSGALGPFEGPDWSALFSKIKGETTKTKIG